MSAFIEVSDSCHGMGVIFTYIVAFKNSHAYYQGTSLECVKIEGCDNARVQATVDYVKQKYGIGKVNDARTPHPACRDMSESA